MTAPDPIQECLLGLHAALGESIPLIIAGGYGLYLKQRSIVHSGLRTLFSPDLLPDNRTTSDIDLFLRAEVVVSATRMKLVRDAVDGLGFAALADELQHQLVESTVVRTYEPGELIMAEDTLPEAMPLFLVVASASTATTAEVDLMRKGKVVTRLKRGDLFGQRFFLTRQVPTPDNCNRLTIIGRRH